MGGFSEHSLFFHGVLSQIFLKTISWWFNGTFKWFNRILMMILILFMLLNAGFMEIFEEFRQLFDAFNWDVASKCQGFDGETLPLFKTVKDWAMKQGFIKVSLEKQSILSDDASTVWWRPPVMDTQIHRSFVIRCITVYLMIVYPPIKLENRDLFSVTSMIFHWKSQGIYCRPSAWTAWRARRCSPVQADPMIRCNIAMERSTIFNR